MGSDKQTDTHQTDDTEANTIVRPYTFYYYYFNLIKVGRTKKRVIYLQEEGKGEETQGKNRVLLCYFQIEIPSLENH
jgi:hypothetical protein